MLHNRFLVIILFFLFSCNKNENPSPSIENKKPPVAKTKLVIEVKNGVLVYISTISNSDSNAKAESFTNLTNFQKEYNSVSVVNAVAEGLDESSTLSIKLIRDGKIINSSFSSGAGELSNNIINWD